MGRRNATLIKACEAAKRVYGECSFEHQTAARQVDRSQELCDHRGHGLYVVRQATLSGSRQPGELWSYCLDCSKPLRRHS